MNKILKALLTPIFFKLYLIKRWILKSRNILFDGDDVLFKKTVREATLYGEYGCGESTNWVLGNTNLKVFAVDTSEEWVKQVKSSNVHSDSKLDIKFIDLGEIGEWGTPIGYGQRDDFSKYTDWIWQQSETPDCVLVDGRFRVCCFLTSLKNAEQGTRIIFDDYVDRPYYHIVEKYVEREEICGRQCLFIVPPRSEINVEDLDREITNFRHVID